MTVLGKRFLACFVALSTLVPIVRAEQVSKASSAAPRLVDGASSSTVFEGREEAAYDAAIFGALQINGIDAPFDAATGTFYVPQSLTTVSWDGTFGWSLESPTVMAPADALIEQKQSAIASGHRFELWVFRKKAYCRLGVVFTGMPMMTVSTLTSNGFFTEAGLLQGSICIFDPAQGGDSYSVSQSELRFHKRGNTSSLWPKPSYRLALTTKAGKANHIPLLGLRNDDDWILNSMYDDPQKNRDAASNDLWNAICRMGETPGYIEGTHTAYTELILDGVYQGVYCLMEPVGSKSAGIENEVDYLYKPYYLGTEIDKSTPVASAEQVYAYGEFKWPERNIRWEQVQSVADYYNALVLGAWNDRLDELYDRIDTDALIDLGLFLDAAANNDSDVKNAYIAGKADADGVYHWSVIPWDMNETFSSHAGDEASASYRRNELAALIRYDPEHILPRMQERWRVLRSSVLSDASIQERLVEHTEYVKASGALDRDSAAWPDCGNIADLSETLA